MTNITCPYCGHEQEICQDDGYGSNQNEIYQTECYECEKTFNFSVEYYCEFTAFADCKNGGDHEWEGRWSHDPKTNETHRHEYCCVCNLDKPEAKAND